MLQNLEMVKFQIFWLQEHGEKLGIIRDLRDKKSNGVLAFFPYLFIWEQGWAEFRFSHRRYQLENIFRLLEFTDIFFLKFSAVSKTELRKIAR